MMNTYIFLALLFLVKSISATFVNSPPIVLETIQKSMTLDDYTYEKNELNVTDDFPIKFTYKNTTKAPLISMIFQLNGQSIAEDPQFESKVIYSTDFKTTDFILSIRKPTAPIMVKFTKSKRILQGDELVIRCQVYANPPIISVVWSRDLYGTDKVAKGPGLSVPWIPSEGVDVYNSSEIQNDTLKFKSLEYEDAGIYGCNMSNIRGSDNVIVQVRVKDRLAALWPFIGIVIEVVILVTAILLYENKRAGAKKSDDDMNAETSPEAVAGQDNGEADGTGDELRQRTVNA